METKKKKLVVTEDSNVGMGDYNPAEKLVVQLPKQEFRVLKSFTVDKVYQMGDIVLLSGEEVIKELKINKYIK